MTVLKNAAAPATIEVSAVETRELPATVLASLTAPPDPHDARIVRLATVTCFGITILAFVLTASAVSAIESSWPALTLAYVPAISLLAFSIGLALSRTVLALAATVPAVRDGDWPGLAYALAKVAGNAVMAWFGLMVAYLGTFGFSRGRQLRRRGQVLLPEVDDGADWALRTFALEDEHAPAGLADQWRENGKTEHASVAAFARLTLDLMALGAPPHLIAAANQDALDEIRHAELCFSLATALDGRRVSPAPFPEAQRVATLSRSRPFALARLAVSSLVDGALHEGVSARIIAQLAKRSAFPAIRDMLKSIAADEGRHSAHGWDVVLWCVEVGGSPVRAALLGALCGLPNEMRTSLPEPAANGGWERWGIHGHALENEEYAAALAHLTARVQALVTTSHRTAA